MPNPLPPTLPSPPRRPRRWRRRLAWTAVALALPSLFFGCTSVVTPPGDPKDPVSVFILREALHIGIVVPDGRTPTQRYIEFGYGDWAYYALGENAWYDTFPTVLWATTGALSRREFVADGPERLRTTAYWTELDELRVASAGVAALRERLEAEFTRRSGQQVEQRHLGMTFVPTDDSYWFGHTCADVAAEWLRELGCTVTFAPIRGSLAVER